jgi:signal transduction histidine kinase
LSDANEHGRLREQSMAVLGHDLRTPLNAISMSADLLATKTEDKRSSAASGTFFVARFPAAFQA